MTTVAPTQQDTALHFFGASADVYSWWRGMEGSWDFRNDAPDGWSMTVKITNPDGPGVLTRLVTHSMLMGAVQRIADGRTKSSEECYDNCVLFLNNPEDADFDANTADEVLQIAVLGKIVYG